MARNSTVKDQILKIIESASRPISASDIQKECKNVDRATVYRALNVLKENQQVRIIEIGDGVVRFESLADHHHHLICLKCGEVKKVDLPEQEEEHLENLQNEFQKKSLFASLQHSLEFFGLCARCKKICGK